MATNFLDYRSRRDPHHKHFMHLGFYAPHPPLNPTSEMFAPYAEAEIPTFRHGGESYPAAPFSTMARMCQHWSDEQLMTYKRYFYAMVTGVDMALGRILDCLIQIDQLDDTLIVFSSDHGDMLGDHRMLGKGNQIYFDEVTRVPWVMHWPNGFGTESQRIEGLVELVDMLPTLLCLCGGHVPEMMVGRSYASALMTRQKPEAREDVLAYSHPGSAMLRSHDYKYCRFPHLGTESLFDLQNDPHEQRDIAQKRPDIVDEMKTRMLDRALEASRSRRAHHFLF